MKSVKISAALLAVLLCFAGCKNSGGTSTNISESSTEKELYITAATTSADRLNLRQDNLPIILTDYGIEITAFISTGNVFVEDGTNREHENTAGIVVKNISGKDITLAAVSFTVNGTYAASFNISTLPSGASAVVQESNGLSFNEKDDYKFVTANVTYSEGFNLHENEVKVTPNGDSLTVENLTDSPFSVVYVYYKTVGENGNYFGGITYRTKFENVGAGEKLTEKTRNFSAESKIMMVDII